MGAASDSMSKALAREKIVKDVSTSKDFKHYIKYRGLSIVEIYSGQWGPCACIFSKLQNIYKDYFDKPIQLVCVNCDDIPQLAEYAGQAQAYFLFYKMNELKEKVEGVNAPLIEKLVAELAPSRDELANTVDIPDSEEDEPAEEQPKRRRSSVSKGLGRRRSIVK